MVLIFKYREEKQSLFGPDKTCVSVKAFLGCSEKRPMRLTC